MADKRMKEKFPIAGLYGSKAAPQRVVLQGMAQLEETLNKRFAERVKQGKARDRHFGVLQEALARTVREAAIREGKGRALHKAVTGLKKLSQEEQEKLRQDIRKRKRVPVRGTAVKQRIFTGSVGATIVPPFDYAWTWTAKGGDPDDVGAEAHKDEVWQGKHWGEAQVQTYTRSAQASWGSARAAVGIYFQPLVDTGFLSLSANPLVEFMWSNEGPSAHSDGWVGLFVGSYTQAGDFDSVVIDMEGFIWSNDTWGNGASDSRTYSAFPLLAQFLVDRRHWYALWVWCGGNLSASGGSLCVGSNAFFNMWVDVPAMTWTLYGTDEVGY